MVKRVVRFGIPRVGDSLQTRSGRTTSSRGFEYWMFKSLPVSKWWARWDVSEAFVIAEKVESTDVTRSSSRRSCRFFAKETAKNGPK
jgi:hypothetical protein